MSDETKREVAKAFTIKCYQEDIDRFNQIAAEMDGVNTNGQALVALMDYFRNPKTVKIKDPEDAAKIRAMGEQINQLQAELHTTKELLENRDHETTMFANESKSLRSELEAAKEAFERGKLLPNQFVVTMHPVVEHFLMEMTVYINKVRAKEKKEPVGPDYVLQDLFIHDLQNPRANNLPYTVTSDDIRRVQRQIEKQEKPDEDGQAEE